MEDSDSVTGKPATRLGSSRRLPGKITPRLKVASGIVASVAAIGAVASGLVGYWQVWKTVRSDFLQTHVSPPHIGSHPTASPRPTVVVLPFINFTGDVSRDGVASNIVRNSLLLWEDSVRNVFSIREWQSHRRLSARLKWHEKSAPITPSKEQSKMQREICAFSCASMTLARASKFGLIHSSAPRVTSTRHWHNGSLLED